MDSEHQLSLAFNSAIDPMWLIRREEPNKFLFETINIAFTKVTGWTPEQVEGQPIERIMPETSHEVVRGKYNEAIQSGKIVDYIEEAQHPSGIKYGEIRVIPIPSREGEPAKILGIANDITEKVYLQKKLEKEQEMRHQQITSAAIRGQESERAKVSRELHDDVNQVLTTVKLYLELLLDQKLAPAEVLPKCITHLTSSINGIRSLSKQLSAPSLGNSHFRETLSDLAEMLRSTTQVEVTIDFNNLPFAELENELHLTLYRITQEQFTNIIKYAKAKKVELSLKVENEVLLFEISDNGIGFDPLQKRSGIGITNMQTRVETVGGTFHLISQPGKGTTLKADIPVVFEDDVCYAKQLFANPLV
ncbi:MAG: PAS domain-containing sensor histidine kinase [Chitinophagaceae bacterium]|nr:MAG: PAS domain-containing sensor histidine kinase [Chitinophagaceae bacterium]